MSRTPDPSDEDAPTDEHVAVGADALGEANGQVESDGQVEGDAEIARAPSVVRSTLRGMALGVGVGSLVFFLGAIPFFTLASFRSNGLDRPFIRSALLGFVLPIAVVVGVGVGIGVGRWMHRGGRWTLRGDEDRYASR